MRSRQLSWGPMLLGSIFFQEVGDMSQLGNEIGLPRCQKTSRRWLCWSIQIGTKRWRRRPCRGLRRFSCLARKHPRFAAGWPQRGVGLARAFRSVLVDPDWNEAMAAAALPGIAALQLHGQETPEFCRRLDEEGIRFAKAL